MTSLALRSLARRRTAFTVCALSIFLGAMVILSFLSLLETAQADGVPSADGETLTTMASVVGGWGVVIVVFSVASTLGVTVRARAVELALLRTIGVTGRQLRRLVVRETLVVAAVASLAAVVPGWLLGRLVLGLVREAGMVAPTVEHRIGVASIGITLVAMLVAAGCAASIAARRASQGSARSSLVAATTSRPRTSRLRVAFGLVLLAGGASCSILTVTVNADSADPYAAMSTAGPACVLVSLGLALVAAPLLRLAAVVSGALLRHGGVSSHLAMLNSRERPQQSAASLAPVVIFVGMATGTLYLVSIQNAVTMVPDEAGESVELLNYVVTGMISVFAAIMVVNTLVATVSERRREFALQRLTGLTGRQVTGMVAYEGVIIVVVGLVLGGLASLATVVPFSLVKTDGWLPDGVGLYAGVCAVAAVVTLGTAVLVTRRAVSLPVVDGIAAAR